MEMTISILCIKLQLWIHTWAFSPHTVFIKVSRCGAPEMLGTLSGTAVVFQTPQFEGKNAGWAIGIIRFLSYYEVKHKHSSSA